MIWLLSVAVGLLVLLVVVQIGGVIAARSRNPRDTLIRDYLLGRFVVTVRTGESFSGLLASVDDQTLILREVTVLSANNSSVDGEVVLRRDSIAYMQKPS